MEDPHKRQRVRRASKQPKEDEALSSHEFWAEAGYSDLFVTLYDLHPGFDDQVALGDEGRISPFMQAVVELEATGFKTLLQAAKERNSPAAFKDLLGLLIQFLNVGCPPGVFTPPPPMGLGRVRRRGAPKKLAAEMTRARWIQRGKPKLDAKVCDVLANLGYPDEYAKAPPRSRARKRLRDRVAKQVAPINKKAPADSAI
jgi:hypothetical protein